MAAEQGRWRFRYAPLGACAVLVAVLGVVYWPLFGGEVLYYRDLTRWIFPARWFLRHALAQGESPFWNPYQGLGFSTLSDPLYGIFYVPNFLHLFGNLPRAVTVVLWL